MTRHVIITGGVVSGLGKGIAAASLGRLFRSRGLTVSIAKLDPYLNTDPGTMNPFEHGEVFVTADGTEVDLDAGHYERFCDITSSARSSVTAGAVYTQVLTRERRGDFAGSTVQVVPHVVDEIARRILEAADGVDVAITEIGGTVGDIESLPFLEAARQLPYHLGRNNIAYVHVTLVPELTTSTELKTKPTQHSVAHLRAAGLNPDVLVCRSRAPLPDDVRDKIARACGLPNLAVISAPDVDSIYEVPLRLTANGFDLAVADALDLEPEEPDLSEWVALVTKIKAAQEPVRVALVGKYVTHPDAYLSVLEAVRHAGWELGVDVQIDAIAAEGLERAGGAGRVLTGVDAVLVPGGFGDRGVPGKLAALTWARAHNVPALGLCLGLQLMVIEAARNLLGIEDATSAEFGAGERVIDLLPDQVDVTDLGGTLRLGNYPAILDPDSKVAQLYGATAVIERHRHRYEVVNRYRDPLATAGLLTTGTSPDGRLVEFVEAAGHPFYVGTQAHPEFLSRPGRPHPLFSGLVQAALFFRGHRLGADPWVDPAVAAGLDEP